MKFIISGGWSYGNIGDEVIAVSTIKLFEKYFRNSDVIYTAYDKQSFEKEYNQKTIMSIHKLLDSKVSSLDDYERIIKNLSKYGLDNYSKLIDENTIFVMSGGGYFNENWISQFVSRLVELYIAKINKAKIIVIGQSIGPIFTAKGKLYLKDNLNNCTYLSVRDNSTYSFLNELNLTIEINLNPDLAVTISDFIKKERTHDYISIMPAAYSSYTSINSKKKNKYYEKIKKRLSIAGILYKIKWKRIVSQLSDKYKVRIVMSVNWEWDKKFVKYITKGNKSNNIDIIYCKDAYDMCKYFSGGLVTISTKMHPIIVSMSYGIPSVAISYDYKVDDFMKLSNSSEKCFRNDEIDVKQVLMYVDDFVNGNNAINNDFLKKKVYKMFEELKKIL